MTLEESCDDCSKLAMDATCAWRRWGAVRVCADCGWRDGATDAVKATARRRRTLAATTVAARRGARMSASEATVGTRVARFARFADSYAWLLAYATRSWLMPGWSVHVL